MIILVFIVIIVAYVILISSFALGFNKVKCFKNEAVENTVRFSVIIPFRNEEKNLPSLLQSLIAIDYAHNLFEIILVNDHSNDNSVAIVNDFKKDLPETFQIRLLENSIDSPSPKKQAITLAISEAKYSWIVTTDADCSVPKLWLKKFNEFIHVEQPNMIVAPVTIHHTKNFLQSFQQLDVLSLQGVTIGAFGIKRPFLSNGANLCYSKNIFVKLNGFEGNSHLASGDDMFLLEKALKFDKLKVSYLKSVNSIVTTNPEQSWKSLIAQRVRWASKAKGYTNAFSKITSITVLLMNAALVCATILALTGTMHAKTMLYFWFIKLNIDLWLIYKSAEFFRQKTVLKFYWISLFIHPFFTTYIAVKSQFGSYTWKQRKFKI